MGNPGENFPTAVAHEVQQSATAEAIALVKIQMEQEGGEAAVRERLGLGAEELAQSVRYGSFEGTLYEAVAKSLPDGSKNKCPIGDMLEAAYQDEGIDGVALELTTMSRQARSRDDGNGGKIKNFDIVISEKTVQSHNNAAQLKKK